MPFNPFKSSSEPTFPPQYITSALAAGMLKRLDPITFAKITAADTQTYLANYKGNEDSRSWSWISAIFPFEDIHDALSSFPAESLDRHTRKSLESFVKQDQKRASERIDGIYKKQGNVQGDAYVYGKRSDKKSDLEILKGYMDKREKGGPPLEEDD